MLEVFKKCDNLGSTNVRWMKLEEGQFLDSHSKNGRRIQSDLVVALG